MKNRWCFLWILFFAFHLQAQEKEFRINFNSVKELQKFLTYSEKSYPLVSAHRGGPMPGFPENCTATFQNAIGYTPLIIETDIALSKDSVLVMMHDDKLDRTTTGTGLIGNYTYDALQAFNLKDTQGKTTPYKIETLDQVLQWGKGKVIFNLDIKKGVPMQMIVDAVRRNKAEAYSVIITYNANQAAEAARLAPDLMISVSARGKEDVERMEALGVKADKMVAFVGTSAPNPEVYGYLHSRNISCIVGTMGNIDKSAAAKGDVLYYQLVANGATILSSDRIIEAGVQLQKYAKDNKLRSKHIKEVKK
ncbi:glycerophosphodiester phosphodiesterase family protein [Flavobacterium sp. TSSA_36]|uniref:glycerophosphodiester phosphodiesterase family protein n=1 Tax=Flavobacterium sp. TSSA_36 TaxID=3447669 RepID=UPI003F3A8CEF